MRIFKRLTPWLLLSLGCAYQTKETHQALRDHDFQQLEHRITNVAHRIDERDWAGLRNLFAEQVQTDYTSLFGGEVQRQAGDVLIDGWKQILAPVTTQHLLGPITVTIDQDTATAQCHVRGYHYADLKPGNQRSASTWMVAGHYTFKLRRIDGDWKITHMKLHTFYQTGNTKLLQQAAENNEG